MISVKKGRRLEKEDRNDAAASSDPWRCPTFKATGIFTRELQVRIARTWRANGLDCARR